MEFILFLMLLFGQVTKPRVSPIIPNPVQHPVTILPHQRPVRQ